MPRHHAQNFSECQNKNKRINVNRRQQFNWKKRGQTTTNTSTSEADGSTGGPGRKPAPHPRPRHRDSPAPPPVPPAQLCFMTWPSPRLLLLSPGCSCARTPSNTRRRTCPYSVRPACPDGERHQVRGTGLGIMVKKRSRTIKPAWQQLRCELCSVFYYPPQSFPVLARFVSSAPHGGSGPGSQSPAAARTSKPSLSASPTAGSRSGTRHHKRQLSPRQAPMDCPVGVR